MGGSETRWMHFGVVLALLLGGAAPVAAGSMQIAPGVTAELSTSTKGVRRVASVRISLPRSPGQKPPDIGPALVAAYDWCAGNVENGLERKWKGLVVQHGCRIDVDSAVYRIRDTAILRQRRRQRAPIEIDFAGSVIAHRPGKARDVRVADLAKRTCNPSREGEYVNVVDAESFDAFDRSDPEGVVEIARIGPNWEESPRCPEGGTVCEFGANAIRIETRSKHGLEDGGRAGLGDVVELRVPNSPYDGQRVLVKEVVGRRSFLATTEAAPAPEARGGTLRETATTAWCNGSHWRAGKPMIAVGGPGDSRQSMTAIRNVRLVFDVSLYRTTGILVDGGRTPNGQGGAAWVTISGLTHVGNSTLRGQILAVLGSQEPDELCYGIEAEVSSDYWPSSWSPAVWNQSCATSHVKIRQHHGGGVWWGTDRPGQTGPRYGSLHGYVEGCKDGPCLWVRSGQVVLSDGFKTWGAVNGPQPKGRKAGPAAGRVAILGTPGGIGVNVTAHGAAWGASYESDLDCYVDLVNVAHFVQVGGYLVSGDTTRGSGKEYLFCGKATGDDDVFVLEHTQQTAWGGGRPRIVRGK